MKLGDNRNKKEVRSEEERIQNRGAGSRRSFDTIVGRRFAVPLHGVRTLCQAAPDIVDRAVNRYKSHLSNMQ